MPTFQFEDKTIIAEEGETVLGALLRHEVTVKHRCKVGACQSCLLRGAGEIPKQAQAGLDETLIERGYFLSCVAKPERLDSVELPGTEEFPRFAASLISTEWASNDVLIVHLSVTGFQARPGRFIRLHHPDGVIRAYSLATPLTAGQDVQTLHVRILPDGEMSGRLRNARPNQEFEIEGPFGRSYYRADSQDQPILLIGSGTGLAPLYGVIGDALHHGHIGPIRLYFGAAHSDRLYFRDELRQIQANHPNFHWITCADESNREEDRIGSPLDHALKDFPDLSGYKVHLCGHPALVKAGQRKCFLAGANLKDIAVDSFEAS